jgi:hypothetical protein
MKFAIASVLLYVLAENDLSVSARSPRKLSKASKVKNYNYETNPVSTQYTVITISHVPKDPEPIDNRNDNQGDPIPVPVVQCKECTDEGEFYSNAYQCSVSFFGFHTDLLKSPHICNPPINPGVQPRPGCLSIPRSAPPGP